MAYSQDAESDMELKLPTKQDCMGKQLVLYNEVCY